ncbi:MAG: hypothetical protein GXY34_00165 [Syntrophomonadaceae bacterium]|nr:hypothetical protein [Syntrophomonadaceae bacterium]
MDLKEAIFKYIKSRSPYNSVGESIPVDYICTNVFKNESYSYEEEQRVIKKLIELESKGLIKRVDKSIPHNKALYYI